MIVEDKRPEKLQKNKINEDLIHQNYSSITKNELFEELFINKTNYIKSFIQEWYPFLSKYIGKNRTFVEIGGGLCYISAIVKNKNPQTVVYATDISPQYLSKKSERLSKFFFDIQPDKYIALDAERMPFENNSIDVIWTQSMMHHLYNVPDFLKEVKRVLSKNGVLISLDTADPLLNRRYKQKKQRRAKKENILENSYTYNQWKQLAKSEGFKVSYVSKHKKYAPLLPLINLWLPTGIIIHNAKLKY